MSYMKVEVLQGDRDKTTFMARRGTFRLKIIPFLLKEIYGQLLSSIRACFKVKGIQYKIKNPLRLFSGKFSLESVAIDILAALNRTPAGNRFVLVITFRISKISRAILMPKSNVAHITAAFLNNWEYPYDIPRLWSHNNFFDAFFSNVQNAYPPVLNLHCKKMRRS